jgi:anti-anti-sigma factor
LLQGLKPLFWRDFMSRLKPRPPKERANQKPHPLKAEGAAPKNGDGRETEWAAVDRMLGHFHTVGWSAASLARLRRGTRCDRGENGDPMTEARAQTWKATPFTIERAECKTAGTVIFRLRGPFTQRDMFASMAPVVVDNMLNFQSEPSEKLPTLNILDLSEVPYMDSAGLGRIVRHYVHCRGKGVRMVAAGVGARVLELFKITKVDAVIPMVATVEEVDV